MQEPKISATRTRVMESLAGELLSGAGRSHESRVLVGIDGVDGSGKSTFARDLAGVVSGRPVILIHADDFLNLREARYRRGRDSPEGFWLDTYDYVSLRRDVLQPLSRGGSGTYRNASSDFSRNVALKAPLLQAPEDAVVIVEGMFLHRDELQGWWDFSCFLDVPFPETARRMATRDGSHPDPEHASMRRYVGGQRLYFEAARPWRRATRVIDNADPDLPRILTAGEASELAFSPKESQ